MRYTVYSTVAILMGKTPGWNVSDLFFHMVSIWRGAELGRGMGFCKKRLTSHRIKFRGIAQYPFESCKNIRETIYIYLQ